MTLAIVGMLVAINPGAVGLALEPGTRDRTRRDAGPFVVGAAVAALVLAAIAAAADPVADAADLSTGTVRLGGAVIVLVAGLRWLALGAPRPATVPRTDAGLAGFVAFPTLVTPAAGGLAVALGVDEGVGPTLAGAALAALVGVLVLAARHAISPRVLEGITRFVGAAAILVGVIVGVDGVETL